MKIVIGDPKSKKSCQAEVPKEKQGALVGLKIGDSVDGGLVGASGYKLKNGEVVEWKYIKGQIN